MDRGEIGNAELNFGRISTLTCPRRFFFFSLGLFLDQNADWCACGALSDNSWSYPIQTPRNGSKHCTICDGSQQSTECQRAESAMTSSADDRLSLILALVSLGQRLFDITIRLQRHSYRAALLRWRRRGLLWRQAQAGNHPRCAPFLAQQGPRAQPAAHAAAVTGATRPVTSRGCMRAILFRAASTDQSCCLFVFVRSPLVVSESSTTPL